jgi:hypothetical protein
MKHEKEENNWVNRKINNPGELSICNGHHSLFSLVEGSYLYIFNCACKIYVVFLIDWNV